MLPEVGKVGSTKTFVAYRPSTADELKVNFRVANECYWGEK